jgi:hypothetical protein
VTDLGAPASLVVSDDLRVDFGSASHRQLDATGGRLDLAPSSVDVVSLTLVGLASPPADLARALGFEPSGGFLHGAAWGVLDPADGRWQVALLTAGSADATASRIDVGRLSDRDIARWAPALDGRTVRVTVFVEATPGFSGVEARFVGAIVNGTRPPSALLVSPTHDELAAVPSPPAPAGWYADPEDDTLYRWWDSLGWTTHTSPR